MKKLIAVMSLLAFLGLSLSAEAKPKKRHWDSKTKMYVGGGEEDSTKATEAAKPAKKAHKSKPKAKAAKKKEAPAEAPTAVPAAAPAAAEKK
jgi:hypothetical protein